MKRLNLISFVSGVAVLAVAAAFYVPYGAPDRISSADTTLASGNLSKDEDGALSDKTYVATHAASNPKAVSALINDLKRGDEASQKHALAALGKMNDANVVQALIKALKSRKEINNRVAKALVMIGKGAVEPLILTLGDPNFGRGADGILVAIGAGAADPLIARLKEPQIDDPGLMKRLQAAKFPEAKLLKLQKKFRARRIKKDLRVRREVVRILGRIDTPRVTQVLLATIEDRGSDILIATLKALSNTGIPQALEPLISLLDHESSKVRDNAVIALGALGTLAVPKAVLPVVARLKDTDYRVRQHAAQTLGVFKDSQTVEALITVLQDRTGSVRDAAMTALVAMGDASAQSLVTAMIGKGHLLKNTAKRALIEIGAPAIEPLIAAFKKEKSWVRTDILKVIGRIKDARTLPFLIEALTDRDVYTRKFAMVAIGNIGDGKAVEPLLISLQTKPMKETIEALGKINDPRAIAPLIRAFSHGSYSGSIAVALKTFGNAAVKPLIAALSDGNKFVRINAVKTLGAIRDARAIAPLVATMKDGDSRVRNNVLKALEALRYSGLYDILLATLRDKAGFVRATAAKALGATKDPRGTDPLIALLKDTDPKPRSQAAAALGVIKSPRAVEPLLAVLKDKSSLVRRAATSSLGAIGDPSAIKPIHKLLTDWYVKGAAGAALTKLGWQPRTEADKIHLLIARRAGNRLRAKALWPTVKKILLSDWANKKGTFNHHYAVRSFVAINKEETDELLVDELWASKSVGLATVYLNAGNKRLASEARKWAHRHRLKVRTLPRAASRGGYRWGNF